MPQTKPAPPVSMHIAVPAVLLGAAFVIAVAATRSAGWICGLLLGAVIAYLVYVVVRATWRLLR